MTMKKVLSAILLVCFAMLVFAGCSATGPSTDGSSAAGSSGITSIIMIVVIFAVFYFLMIRPENKRKKKAQEMRDAVEVGDKITTIGGMVGRVVHVAGDKLTFETGEDRVRIEVAKWAISSNDGKGADKDKTDSEETLSQ